MDIPGRHCDISPCPSLKKGGQWNILPYRWGFRHQLQVHSIAPLFPCQEVEQSILLPRIQGKTWACLHVKSHYLCYALGRWGAVGTSHQTTVRSGFLYALCWTMDWWKNIWKCWKGRNTNETDGKQETGKDSVLALVKLQKSYWLQWCRTRTK